MSHVAVKACFCLSEVFLLVMPHNQPLGIFFLSKQEAKLLIWALFGIICVAMKGRKWSNGVIPLGRI